MKKRKVNWKTAGVVTAGVGFLVLGGLMYGKMKELTNQLAYLQDSTNIILSDVSGMQSNIEKTLQKEASMIEAYSINVTGMDFSQMVYKVEISVIPKEYTDSTRVSIFFGTTECKLKSNGYRYEGTVSLPIGKSFDGNATFLIANGKKKTTEVVEDFEGINGKFAQVLSGSLSKQPVIKDGKLILKGNCDFSVDGAGLYTFRSLKLVGKLGDQEIWTQDLMQDIRESEEEKTQGESGTEQIAVETETNALKQGSGTCECALVYAPNEEADGDQIPDSQQQTGRLRIFLRAVTTDGYRFETDLFGVNYLVQEQLLDTENADSEIHKRVYDLNGHELELKE